MPTMVLRFPGGRYHATPGGHHVNEGVVEWPPSPWRLVRALIACGFATQHWNEVPPEGRRLVENLSGALPEYRLPKAALGHSRHYMPTTKLKNSREDTTLVLDSFADVGDGELWVRWPVKIGDAEQRLFDLLVEHLGYLGRSESWVLGKSIDDGVPLPDAGRAFPQWEHERPGRSFEQITLIAPEIPCDYATWRKHEIESAIKDLKLPVGKMPTQAQHKKIDEIERTYPPGLVDCMQRDTSWWKAQKWSRAPGTRPVVYWRESNALEIAPSSSLRVSNPPRVEMMLLALTTPTGSNSALPPVARTLPQAELFHVALVSKLGFGGEACPEITGLDELGKPLKGHRHTHVLPVDFDCDGRIDHIVVYAPMGLGARGQHAVRSVRMTYMKSGVGELHVSIAGIGTLNDLRAIGGGLSSGVDELLGPTNGATTWITNTPFVPPRHVKKSGRSSIEGQVQEELISRGFTPSRVDVLQWTARTLTLRHFVRQRRRGPEPPHDIGFAVQISFNSPVAGPICIGYGCHFGLGRFRPVDDSGQK